jgi:hypothetical protein
MLDYLQGTAGDRKLRLFAVACCRRLLGDYVPEFGEYLDWAELFADGEAGSEILEPIGHEVNELVNDYGPDSYRAIARAVACAVQLPRADCFGLREAALQVLAADRFSGENWGEEERKELSWQASLLRDLFGPLPFLPLPLDRSWLTPAVVGLAQSIYEQPAFDRLPELSARIEAAGCRDAKILGHFHRAGPHCHGCFVLDAILGKA